MAEDAVARTQIVDLGQRVNRCEGDISTLRDERSDCRERHETMHGDIWRSISRIDKELARVSVRVAVYVGVISAIGSAIASAVISYVIK